jgi:hypothetical protein
MGGSYSPYRSIPIAQTIGHSRQGNRRALVAPLSATAKKGDRDCRVVCAHRPECVRNSETGKRANVRAEQRGYDFCIQARARDSD